MCSRTDRSWQKVFHSHDGMKIIHRKEARMGKIGQEKQNCIS